ncbi:MAG: hypothetical protein FJ295_14420 [Planctomycetes bacterium]|nr:hypothetical protein [Planctomycetota bacterium]
MRMPARSLALCCAFLSAIIVCSPSSAWAEDSPPSKEPDFNASFGQFGNALVISCFEDGRIFGCQVVHDAHGDRQGFSSVGAIRIHDFEYEDGQLTGTIKTEGFDWDD